MPNTGPNGSHGPTLSELQDWANNNVANYRPKNEPPRSFPQSTTSVSSYQSGPLRSDSVGKATYAEVKQWEYGKPKPFEYQNLKGYSLVRDPHGNFADGTRRPGYRKYTPKSTTNSTNDLYAILGVSRKATPLEIRKEYHKLARQLHPDKAKDVGKAKDDNEAKLKDISAAYAVLNDEDTRKYYDDEGLVPPAKPPPK
ncbi:DnaJ domain-containing protein [Paraphoma chrysanthemicola]|nr:DnaJ domain-containing protein [Paraphoma chrysanthemicola]